MEIITHYDQSYIDYWDQYSVIALCVWLIAETVNRVNLKNLKNKTIK